MSHSRINITLVIACVLCVVTKANAQETSSPQHYPEAALVQIFTQEQIEQKKADELEQKLVRQRDTLEKKKREAEKEIAAHRFQIEGLKMQQEKSQSELDGIAVDMQHANGDLASYKSEHQQLVESTKATLEYLQSQRDELAVRQKQVDEEIASLSEARKKTEKNIYNMGMDIERYKVSIAKVETKVQEAETQRAGLEADEMKIRSEWMANKLAVAEQNRQRDQALSELAEAKHRYEQAQREFAQSKVELLKAQTQRNDTARKSQAQIAQFEHDILQANKARIAAESEHIRLESEVAKIQDYSSRIKDSRDQAVDQKATTEGLVLKSSLALESARSALTTSVEKADQDQYKTEKAAHRARGLAAAEEASQMVDGRVWILSENCKSYSKPTTNSNASQVFEPGKRLLAKDHGSKWVEIMNGSSSVFVESRCGNFEH